MGFENTCVSPLFFITFVLHEMRRICFKVDRAKWRLVYSMFRKQHFAFPVISQTCKQIVFIYNMSHNYGFQGITKYNLCMYCSQAVSSSESLHVICLSIWIQRGDFHFQTFCLRKKKPIRNVKYDQLVKIKENCNLSLI